MAQIFNDADLLIWPGYLVVRSRLQVRTLSELPDEDANDLGLVLKRLVRAIDTLVRPIRVYVAQFGEEDQSLHFHLFPRTEALTREYLRQFPEQRDLIHGPLLLDWAREWFRSDKMSEAAIQLLSGLRSGHRGLTVDTRHLDPGYDDVDLL